MSNLTVWPYGFTLQIASLIEAYRRGFTQPTLSTGATLQKLGIPVALRWSTTPELGFPRRPFNVYRRLRLHNLTVTPLTLGPLAVNGSVDIPLGAPGGDLMYLVYFEIEPAPGQDLFVAAYDLYGRPIPSLTYFASSLASNIFACPGIAGMRVSGQGTVVRVQAITQTVYANLGDWQLIQVVGLPAKKGELGADYNDTIPQGYEIALTNGLIAAEERLFIAELLRDLPQGTGDPSFPLPAWPPSIVPQYLLNLRSASNLFPMIARCLHNSVDSNPTKMQSLYTETVNLDGIKQANLPGATADPSKPSSAVMPVVNLSMLAVSTDSDAATALGYGTIDIPALDTTQTPAGNPPAIAAGVPRAMTVVTTEGGQQAYDYMVTAPFVLPFGLQFELAALSQLAPDVQSVSGFNAGFLQNHAVLQRDTTAQVAVDLTWQAPSQPQAYALLASRQPFQSVVLNTPRPPRVHGFDPYVGLPPSSNDPNISPADLLPNFKDAAGQLPADGSATTRYLAAGIDVFGRWSVWTEADITLNAAPITKPGLRNVAFNVGALPASGKVVPYDLVIEVLWDWTDRSPGVIRISGDFVSPGSNLGPAFLSGLAMNNVGAAGSPLLLTWNYGANNPATVAPNLILPSIDAGHSGTVELLTDVSGVSGNQVMQYRVTLHGFSLDYSLGDEIDLAIYATAQESIRPGEWSDATDPVQGFIGRIVKAFNPLPPVVNFTPPSINWTALPDAYNRARGILQWGADPSAAGYVVWESTEGALLQLLSPGTPNPDPNAALVTRGATLKSLVAANYDKALQSFSRLNASLIQASRAEVELPGNAAVLYAYMISAVSSQGVEAARPPQIAVFGVPQRTVPGQPRLRVRQLPLGTNGIQIIALPVETGVVPAGYRVHRVRSSALAADAGLMGPPKILETDAGWQPYTEQPLRGGTSTKGQSIVDAAASVSWYPYYYRVVAIGPDDPANGEYSGRSLPSQVQSGYCLPPNPPLIQALTLSEGDAAALLVFTTDLPIPPSPLGMSEVALLKAKPDPANNGRILQSVVLASAPDAITQGTLHLPKPWVLPPPPFPPHPPHPPKPVMALLPKPFPPPRPFPPPAFRGPAFARSAPDAQGQWTLYVLVPYTAADLNTFTVRLTDPLGRQSSTTF